MYWQRLADPRGGNVTAGMTVGTKQHWNVCQRSLVTGAWARRRADAAHIALAGRLAHMLGASP